MGTFFSVVGSFLIVIIGLCLLVLYLRNIYKIYLDIQNQKYGLLTLLRVAGIPFFILGILLGLV